MAATVRKIKATKRAREDEVVPSVPQDTPSNEMNREQLLETCQVFRVMNGAAVVGKSMTLLRRSDVVEVLKCKFGVKDLTKAYGYFSTYFTTPLTKLRFQAWISSTQTINTSESTEGDAVSILAFNVLHQHAKTLKTCDLSRNRLSGPDLPLIVGPQGLNLAQFTNIEVLDLSYNPIGNEGAAALFQAIQPNASIRAVILRHCNIDDEGAAVIGDHLRRRPTPQHNEAQKTSAFFLKIEVKLMFFVNLNENRIGATGTRSVAHRLPDFVSVTVVKQQPKLAAIEKSE